MSRCITIYTDASVCPKTGAGGWAAWIKTAPGETALHSGAFKTRVTNSTDAEMRAIANALAIVKKLYDTKDCIIVVVTDSQQAIGTIDIVRFGDKKPLSKKTKRNRKKRGIPFKALADSIVENQPPCIELRLNWVKGHNGNKDGARSYVNRLVDNASRKKMREARLQKGAPGENTSKA